MPAPYVRLGRITKTHGLDGEVVLALREGLPAEHLDGLTVWVVPPPSRGARPLIVTGTRQGPKGLLVSFDAVSDRAEAHDLAGRWLLAAEGDVPGFRDAHDGVEGYAVIDEQRGQLGTIAEVIETGANDVLVVDGGAFGQVLIPVIDEVVLGIDDDRRVVSVRLLRGLIEEQDG